MVLLSSKRLVRQKKPSNFSTRILSMEGKSTLRLQNPRTPTSLPEFERIHFDPEEEEIFMDMIRDFKMEKVEALQQNGEAIPHFVDFQIGVNMILMRVVLEEEVEEEEGASEDMKIQGKKEDKMMLISSMVEDTEAEEEEDGGEERSGVSEQIGRIIKIEHFHPPPCSSPTFHTQLTMRN